MRFGRCMNLAAERGAHLRRCLTPGLCFAVLLSTRALAAEPLNVPEEFFRGDVQPNGVVRFVYIKPNLPDQARDTGYWNAVAKFHILVERDQEFRAAYMAVSNDPELQATGITQPHLLGGRQERRDLSSPVSGPRDGPLSRPRRRS